MTSAAVDVGDAMEGVGTAARLLRPMMTFAAVDDFRWYFEGNSARLLRPMMTSAAVLLVMQ